jgi:hypothetical protein
MKAVRFCIHPEDYEIHPEEVAIMNSHIFPPPREKFSVIWLVEKPFERLGYAFSTLVSSL